MRVKCRGTSIKPDINLKCITCHFHVPVRILIIIIFVIPIQGEKEFIPCLQSEGLSHYLFEGGTLDSK